MICFFFIQGSHFPLSQKDKNDKKQHLNWKMVAQRMNIYCYLFRHMLFLSIRLCIYFRLTSRCDFHFKSDYLIWYVFFLSFFFFIRLNFRLLCLHFISFVSFAYSCCCLIYICFSASFCAIVIRRIQLSKFNSSEKANKYSRKTKHTYKSSKGTYTTYIQFM